MRIHEAWLAWYQAVFMEYIFLSFELQHPFSNNKIAAICVRSDMQITLKKNFISSAYEAAQNVAPYLVR